MLVEPIKRINYDEVNKDTLAYLDAGGILHVTKFPGSREFFKVFQNQYLNNSSGTLAAWNELFIDRNIRELEALAAATRVLKILVHNHAFAMAALPLVERIGCCPNKTHIDSGVIRYQLTNNLREEAESSGLFENEDFMRPDPHSIPEIFGSYKLPPHRDVRWPHIRILGGWMPLTNLDEGETLTLFPEVFGKAEAITDPAITPFPDVKNPTQFGLGRPVSPTMQAGDFLLFHASTVHSSPVKQSAPFRGSIDFRIAYPCLDDFSHYKWTFIQANNLINCEDEGQEINLSYQNQALDSLISQLFQGTGAQKSIQEIWLKYSDKNMLYSTIRILQVVLSHFCPDTHLKIFDDADRTGQRLLLLSVLLRSRSYFWLYQGYLVAKKNKFFRLTKFLKYRAIKAAMKTKLPIKNSPITWPGEPRELLPEKVLQELLSDR